MVSESLPHGSTLYIYISSTTTERDLFPATIINPLLLKYSSVLIVLFFKKVFFKLFLF